MWCLVPIVFTVSQFPACGSTLIHTFPRNRRLPFIRRYDNYDVTTRSPNHKVRKQRACVSNSAMRCVEADDRTSGLFGPFEIV